MYLFLFQILFSLFNLNSVNNSLSHVDWGGKSTMWVLWAGSGQWVCTVPWACIVLQFTQEEEPMRAGRVPVFRKGQNVDTGL